MRAGGSGLQRLFNAFDDRAVRDIGIHSGAGRRHGLPVGHIRQNAGDKGPLPTHSGLDRVDGADLVPENAVAVVALGDHPSLPGLAGIIRLETLG